MKFLATLALAIVTMLLVADYTNAQGQPTTSVDLLSKGLPADAFKRLSYKECLHQYLGYRAVEWLDSRRLLVAFNTSPDCSKHEGLVSGLLRLITFDLEGEALHSTDVPYDAGGGMGVRLILHDGVWVGPQETVIVEIPNPLLRELPNSRDRVLLFSDDLTWIQKFNTESQDPNEHSIFFKSVTNDRRKVVFWTVDAENKRERTCIGYTRIPLVEAEECSSQELDSIGTE